MRVCTIKFLLNEDSPTNTSIHHEQTGCITRIPVRTLRHYDNSLTTLPPMCHPPNSGQGQTSLPYHIRSPASNLTEYSPPSSWTAAQPFIARPRASPQYKRPRPSPGLFDPFDRLQDQVNVIQSPSQPNRRASSLNSESGQASLLHHFRGLESSPTESFSSSSSSSSLSTTAESLAEDLKACSPYKHSTQSAGLFDLSDRIQEQFNFLTPPPPIGSRASSISVKAETGVTTKRVAKIHSKGGSRGRRRQSSPDGFLKNLSKVRSTSVRKNIREQQARSAVGVWVSQIQILLWRPLLEDVIKLDRENLFDDSDIENDSPGHAGVRPMFFVPNSRLNSNNSKCSGLEAKKEETLQVFLDNHFWREVLRQANKAVLGDVRQACVECGIIDVEKFDQILNERLAFHQARTALEDAAYLLVVLSGEMATIPANLRFTAEELNDGLEECQFRGEGVVDAIVSVGSRLAMCSRLQSWLSWAAHNLAEDCSAAHRVAMGALHSARDTLQRELQRMHEYKEQQCMMVEKLTAPSLGGKQNGDKIQAADNIINSMEFRIGRGEAWLRAELPSLEEFRRLCSSNQCCNWNRITKV